MTQNCTRAIPFQPLGGIFEDDDVEAVASVLQSATSGAGFFPIPEEDQFQECLASREGSARAVAVNSCGTALDLCMHSLGLAHEDEVIVSPLTFVCSATCAAALGARIVFSDIDPLTLNLSAASAASRVSPRTRAIIAVHFAGLPCDIDAFEELSKRTGIPVIYDAAHAVGAKYKGRTIGGAGKASCYSFQSNKNMTTLGEGGAVTTNDPAFAETVRQKKTFGFVYGAKPRVVTVGFNYRMTKPQLACGLSQLAKLDRVIALRLQRFRCMYALLSGIDELILPYGIEEGHACHLFAVRVNTERVRFSRDELLALLKNKHGIQTAIHYPAVWTWDVFQQIPNDHSECPIAERACDEIFSLPIFPQSPLQDLEYIRDCMVASIAELRGA
jgi:perosamine synthetase